MHWKVDLKILSGAQKPKTEPDVSKNFCILKVRRVTGNSQQKLRILFEAANHKNPQKTNLIFSNRLTMYVFNLRLICICEIFDLHKKLI